MPILALLASLAFAGDAPEISRSVGEPGGIVVLWPRIIPASEDPAIVELAASIQLHLRAVADQAVPGVKYDIRPAPERVCPRSGCKGLAIGTVLLQRDGACAAVVTISKPGPTDQLLVPWGGLLTLKSTTVPFREPPESQVTIRDFVRCESLIEATVPGDAAVLDAITAARAE